MITKKKCKNNSKQKALQVLYTYCNINGFLWKRGEDVRITCYYKGFDCERETAVNKTKKGFEMFRFSVKYLSSISRIFRRLFDYFALDRSSVQLFFFVVADWSFWFLLDLIPTELLASSTTTFLVWRWRGSVRWNQITSATLHRIFSFF